MTETMTQDKNIHYIAIAAMAKNRVIGNNGKIPWYIPEDFKHFKDTTSGHPIIMGRKTFESIGRILPWRENIVLTRGDFSFEGLTVIHSIDTLDNYLQDNKVEKAFICWGSQIYEEFFRLGKTDEVILSVVDMTPDGDAAFPYFEEEFTKVSEDKREGFTIEHWKKWNIPHQSPH
jgi:dihydrofolate reductase